MLLNMVGAGANGGLPAFTYTGQSQIIDDGKANGKQNWLIKFLSSGTLVFHKDPGSIDTFLLGGGGGGASGGGGNGGGGGGYTATHKGIVVTKGTSYAITIGAGGAAGAAGGKYNGAAGGKTTAFGSSVNGGNGGTTN